ncbi:16S rRNA (cytidine(1402)-2'-O)-methyltransferase [Clostridia bacterium]|nr:16S rRNA (cytidine(1402)-2'-O)-methyltransferase [Clostridia bacterium]
MDTKGQLILVTTPIGNLDEMTPRAVSVLQNADVVAAEDTRVSRKLFNRFEIRTHMLSYHKYNEKERAPELIEKMLAGKTVAVITDAGIPCISDPGNILVKESIAAGIPVLAVGCGSAAMHALVVSGLPADRFYFQGFLPKEKNEKRKMLEGLLQIKETMIFYISPHAIKKELSLIREILSNREASLSREMTKFYEETRRGTLEELITSVEENKPQGEMVLVVAGAKPVEMDTKEAYSEMVALIEAGLRVKAAASYVANKYEESKRELYNRYIEEEKNSE